jgi:glycosyltransferase 2 family protein
MAEQFSSRGKSAARLAVKLAISALLLIVLAWIANPRELARALASAEAPWLLASLTLAIGNRILMGLKWTLLIRAIDVPVAWSVSVKAYFAASFAGIFLPATVGADAVRTLILSKRYSNTPRIIASIIVERLIGLLALAMFAFVGVLVVLNLYAGIIPLSAAAGLVIVAVAVALAVGCWFVTTPSFGALVRRGVGWIGKSGGPRARLAATLGDVQGALALYRGKPAPLAGFFLLTCLENLVAIIRAWFVALAFGIEIGVVLFFVITPIEQFASRLPISIHGFGIREGLFMYALSLVGVSAATGLAVGLVNHLVFIVAVLPGIWFLLMGRRQSADH